MQILQGPYVGYFVRFLWVPFVGFIATIIKDRKSGHKQKEPTGNKLENPRNNNRKTKNIYRNKILYPRTGPLLWALIFFEENFQKPIDNQEDPPGNSQKPTVNVLIHGRYARIFCQDVLHSKRRPCGGGVGRVWAECLALEKTAPLRSGAEIQSLGYKSTGTEK